LGSLKALPKPERLARKFVVMIGYDDHKDKTRDPGSMIFWKIFVNFFLPSKKYIAGNTSVPNTGGGTIWRQPLIGECLRVSISKNACGKIRCAESQTNETANQSIGNRNFCGKINQFSITFFNEPMCENGFIVSVPIVFAIRR